MVGIGLSVLLGALAAAAVFWGSNQLPTTYAAQASVFASSDVPGADDVQEQLIPIYALQVYASAATTEDVISRVSARLATETGVAMTPHDIQAALTVSIENAPSPTTGFIYIDATSTDQNIAVGLANLVAQELVAWDIRRSAAIILEARTSSQQRTAHLDQRIQELSAVVQGAAGQSELAGLIEARAEAVTRMNLLDSLSPLPKLETFETATGRARVVGPNPLRNAAVAFAVVLLVSYGAYLARQVESKP